MHYPSLLSIAALGASLTHAAPIVETFEERAANFRFLTNTTSAFQVTSLPDIPYDVGELYSGLMPIKSGVTSRELFFVFQPKIGEPTDDITIWLNGGPGCSSLEGFLEENGLFLWEPGATKPSENPYSWVRETNMIWVEQPIGTGYTVGTPTATTEEQIAADFVGFFKNFQTTFGIKNFKVYVTGESYAGRYIPYISAAILNQDDKENFDLAGALIYDGCIGQFDYIQEQVPVYPFVKDHADVFGLSTSTMSQLQNMHKSCGYESYLNKYLTFPAAGVQPVVSTKPGCDIFSAAANAATAKNSCFNIYEVNQTCPTPLDPLADDIFTSGSTKTVYFNRADVKKAMHAPSTVTWTECSNRNVFVGRGGPEGEGDLSLDSIQKVLPQVIEATNRTLIVNGDLDMIILTNGSLLAIQNMTWNGGLGFEAKPTTPVLIDGASAGLQTLERGLLWSETFYSGHMGPEFQPAVALRHLQWLLGKIESL